MNDKEAKEFQAEMLEIGKATIPGVHIEAIIQGEPVSEYAINQWREWMHYQLDNVGGRGIRGDSTKHPVVDEIFDLALLGARKARRTNKEVNRLVKAKLTDLANSLGE